MYAKILRQQKEIDAAPNTVLDDEQRKTSRRVRSNESDAEVLVAAIRTTSQDLANAKADSARRASKMEAQTEEQFQACSQSHADLEARLERDIADLSSHRDFDGAFMDSMAYGMSGNVHLLGDDAEDIGAAELNAAVAGSFTRLTTMQFVAQFVVDAQTLSKLHTWATFEPTVLATTDDDVTVPTVTAAGGGDPMLNAGNCPLLVTFITDEGVSEEYTAGKKVEVAVTIPVGCVGAGTTVTKRYNIIA